MFGYEVQDGISMEEQFHGRSSFLPNELSLAKIFVLKSFKPEPTETFCHACGVNTPAPLFNKWGVQYFICTECWTIFAPSLAKEVKAFEKASPLTDLRSSIKYQEYAAISRAQSWDNLIKWMGHRLFRYTEQISGRKALIRSIRYGSLLKKIKEQQFFSRLDVKGSLIAKDDYQSEGGYGTILYLDSLQRRTAPLKYLREAYDLLETDGLLFLTARIGTGFDILTLKGQIETIYPYEHIFLPSVLGLEILLEKAGFKVLEASTPGMLDVAQVFKQRHALEESNLFARFLTSTFNERMLADFQKFLQKYGLSSNVHVVAQKI